MEEKTKAMRAELASMRKLVTDARIKEIELELKEPGESKAMLAKIYDDLRAEDLIHIGKAFIGTTSKLIALASLTENVVMLFSDGKAYDCGKLIKDNAHIYNGKGGGRPDNARALFPNREYLETFIDLLDKHLR